VRRTVALAQEIGAKVVIAHLPRRIRGILVQYLWRRGHRTVIPLPWGGDLQWLTFIQGSLAQWEEATGVTVAVENMPARRIGPFRLNPCWLNTMQEMETIPHITLDTTHLGTWGSDPLAFYEHLKDHIAHVHLSNFDGREHRLLEDGQLALSQFLARLSADGYGGVVTLETHPDALEAEDEERVRAHLERSLGFCRQHLAAT
jgi:sugar phosphate isomerase/epimerase